MAKILILSNQEEIRPLLSNQLKHDGHWVDIVENPKVAIARLPGLKPDLVLLDHHLDEIVVWEMLRTIKKRIPSIPALIYVINSRDAIPHIRQAVAEIVDKKRLSDGVGADVPFETADGHPRLGSMHP